MGPKSSILSKETYTLMLVTSAMCPAEASELWVTVEARRDR